ncbi:carbohydrate ABC transporter permease [Kribbella sandramycini]|nr:carbohydrate ABC transporter permease [Kribbella sandramycini]NOL39705.1 carbohydrate ABC transporter permease [Kribbella sandramycini]
MIITSGKTNQQFERSFWAPDLPFHLENYATAWNQIRPYLLNSVQVAVISIVITAVIASVSGFVLSRYRFPGRRLLYGLVLVLMAVPGITNLIPLFVMMRDFNLLNTYVVLVIPYATGGIVLGTILMRNFIDAIPQSIYDAARVDGAGAIRMYTHVTLPLSFPALGSISLITLTTVWNDFFWPLLVISDDRMRTVSVGLQYFQGQNAISYGPLMAGYLLASVPLVVVFVLLSKYFLAGVQGGLAGSQ